MNNQYATYQPRRQSLQLLYCMVVLFYSEPVIPGSQDHLLRHWDAPGDLPASARPRLRIQARRGQREAQDQVVAGK